MRDALEQAKRVIDVELNAVTDNPLLVPGLEGAKEVEDQVVSAGHFHGMPLALVLSYLKASIPVLAVFLLFQRQILSGLLAGAEK